MAWKYIEQTKENEKIEKIFLDRNGFMTIVAKTPSGRFNVHQEYDPSNSNSYYGHYWFETQKEAIEDIQKHCGHGPYTEFDPENKYDLLKVRLAYFLYNHSNMDLGKWNHRTDLIILDAMTGSDWKRIYDAQKTKEFENTPIGFLRFIDDYNERNSYLIGREF